MKSDNVNYNIGLGRKMRRARDVACLLLKKQSKWIATKRRARERLGEKAENDAQ